MSALTIVLAAGLTTDLAVRGDVAANLSDLIAEGSFVDLAPSADLAALKAELGSRGVPFVELPCGDLAEFDAALGALRAPESALVVVSEEVFVSQKELPRSRSSRVAPGSDAAGLISALIG